MRVRHLLPQAPRHNLKEVIREADLWVCLFLWGRGSLRISREAMSVKKKGAKGKNNLHFRGKFVRI